MEVNSNSLLVGLLSICALPLLLLSLVVFAVFMNRLRIKEGKQIRKKIREGAYSRLINNKETFILVRILVISSLVVFSIIFAGFLFVVSRPLMLMPPDSNGKWLYILMIGLPLACSVPVSVFALLWAYRTNK